jgi:hypothetical protein
LGKNKQKSAGAPALVYRRGRDAAPETFEKKKRHADEKIIRAEES